MISTQPELHIIESRIRYLTTDEKGRKTTIMHGYRGQFQYDNEIYDGFQYFPDLASTEWVVLGIEVRAFIRILRERWLEWHRERVFIGMPFTIGEGRKIVGHGIVTRTEVPDDEWRGVIPF